MVIAIIGILASLLLPALGRERETARRSVCMSNLRQVYSGIQGYANDIYVDGSVRWRYYQWRP